MNFNISMPRINHRHIIYLAMAIAFSMLMASGAHAVDFTKLKEMDGPLASALGQLDSLSEGMKALVGFLAFAVAFITLAALRNMGPIMLFIGVAIFGAVGLSIGGAILGATI